MTNSMIALEAYLAAIASPFAMIYNVPRGRRAKPDDPIGDALVAILEGAKQIEATAKAEQRSLTDGERLAIDNLYAQFQRLEEGGAPAPQMRESLGRRTDPDDLVDMDAPRAPRAERRPVRRELQFDGQPIREDGPQRVLSGTDSRSWRNMFQGSERDHGGWRGAGEFFATLHSGRADPRLIRDTAGQSEGIGADGGFYVPGVVLSGIMDSALEQGVMRAGANVAPIASNSASVPIWDYQDHSTGIGGFVGHWIAEGAEADIQKGSVRHIQMIARKLGIWSKMTSEVAEDSPTFVRDFTDALAKAVAFYEDEAYITGIGVAQPLGYLNDPAYIAVTKESGQSADTVVYGNLVNAMARMHPASFANSVWICNPTCLPQLLSLSVPVTAGQQHVPVLNESNGSFRLLSRPVLLSEKAPVVGDTGDIVLIDRSQYLIAMRRQATMMTNVAAHWTTDEIGVRITMRVDARGKWAGPVTPRNGSTLSWVVGIEAR